MLSQLSHAGQGQIMPLKLYFHHVLPLLNNSQCLSIPSGISFKSSNLVFEILSQLGSNLQPSPWITHYNSCSCPTTKGHPVIPAFVRVFFSPLFIDILPILQSPNATFFFLIYFIDYAIIVPSPPSPPSRTPPPSHIPPL